MKWLAMPVLFMTYPYVCLLIFYYFCGLMIVFQGIGQARNLSTLDSDRLAFHSSRVSKTGPHARYLALLLSHIVMMIMVVVIVVVIITIIIITTTIITVSNNNTELFIWFYFPYQQWDPYSKEHIMSCLTHWKPSFALKVTATLEWKNVSFSYI